MGVCGEGEEIMGVWYKFTEKVFCHRTLRTAELSKENSDGIDCANG